MTCTPSCKCVAVTTDTNNCEQQAAGVVGKAALWPEVDCQCPAAAAAAAAAADHLLVDSIC